MRRASFIQQRRRRAAWATVAALGALGLPGAGAQAATLTADYQFQGTHDSSVPGAAAPTDVGPGGANPFVTDNVLGQTQQVLAFPMDNGLSLTPASGLLGGGGSYSIVMLVRLQDTAGYRRLVDFANATSDSGFYEQGGTLVLYPVATGTGDQLFPTGQYVQVALTRDASGMVTGYLNRTQVLGPYDDSTTNDAVLTADNVLRFFIDDSSVGGEDSAGDVARIRLYDGPLTAAEVGALAPPPATTPVLGKNEVASVVSGTVRISLPGGQFAPLTGTEKIPVGATLDTLHGTVALTGAVDTRGHAQSGRFNGGVFKFTQSSKPRDKGLTTLRLNGANRGACRRRATATAAAVTPLRQLHGRAHGHFRTVGHYSAATVRGTIWTVADQCNGTLTTVTRGVVAVQDFARHKTVTVRAGQRYLARP